jgi:hypothetical protein
MYKIRTIGTHGAAKLLNLMSGSPRMRFYNFFSERSLMFPGPAVDSNLSARYLRVYCSGIFDGQLDGWFSLAGGVFRRDEARRICVVGP